MLDFDYKSMMDSFTQGHIDFIIENLPVIPDQAAIIDQEENGKWYNLDKFPDYGFDDIISFLRNKIQQNNAVGIVIAVKSLYIDMEGDPQEEDFNDGLIDVTSIPDEKKTFAVSVYSEFLGAHRAHHLIHIDADGNFAGKIKVKDAKKFRWFPLIPMNDRVN